MKQLSIISFLLLLSIPHLFAQSGLKADYYDGKDFNRYVASNYVDKIDFYWLATPPVEGINPRECSIRYTGQIKSPKTGEITFSARVDDGIRVWVEEVLIIDNWKLNDVGYSSGKVNMIADSLYNIKIEYFNALLEAELRLLWELPEEEEELAVVEEKSWFAKWWSPAKKDRREVIGAQYFQPPVEKKPTINPEPELAPIVAPKPKPKPKIVPKPKKVKKKPKIAVKPQKKADIIEESIPKSVEFNQAKSEILPISYPALDKLADYLKKHPAQKVRIEGHTDNVGNAEKNLHLSERRAYAVAAYLVKKGVSAKQLSAKGYGGSKPLVVSQGKQYSPENRRVEFIIE